MMTKRTRGESPPLTGPQTIHPGWVDQAFWARVAHLEALEVAEFARRRERNAAKRAQVA